MEPSEDAKEQQPSSSRRRSMQIKRCRTKSPKLLTSIGDAAANAIEKNKKKRRRSVEAMEQSPTPALIVDKKIKKEYKLVLCNAKGKKPKKKDGRALYAVFNGGSNGFAIYKLDHWPNGGHTSDSTKFYPIKLQNDSNFRLDTTMLVFSARGKIYFCGGLNFANFNYKRHAFMFDTRSENPTVVRIGSMAYSKPNPLVIEALDGMVYVYSYVCERYQSRKSGRGTFEMLNTITDKWETLPSPPIFGKDYFRRYSVCGSNILMGEARSSRIYVFSTVRREWHVLELDQNNPYPLPFFPARHLFDSEHSHFFLSMVQSPQFNYEHRPMVSYFPKDRDSIDHVQYLGFEDVQFLMPKLRHGLDKFVSFSTVSPLDPKNKHSISSCIVGAEDLFGPSDNSSDRFFIKICELGLVEELNNELQIKAENTLQFRLRSKINLYPRHFLLA